MTDLSDGLASDLRHIAEQSHVGATVDLERIPIAPGSDLVTALTGGEDYKLLFTAAPEALPALCRAFESRFGRPLYPIGTVTEAEDDTIVWLDRGRPGRGPTGAGTNTTPEPVPAGRRTASVRKIFRKGQKSFETADLFAILGA